MEVGNKDLKTHLNYGMLTGVILIVLFVLFYVFNVIANRLFEIIPILALFILIIIAQITHARALNGNITYGNLFAMGFKTAAAATAIYVLFLIIFLLLVPSFKDHIMEVSRRMMVEKGLSADQINKGISMARKSFTIVTIGGAIFGKLVEGIIASLIGAAIARKNPQPQLPQL